MVYVYATLTETMKQIRCRCLTQEVIDKFTA